MAAALLAAILGSCAPRRLAPAFGDDRYLLGRLLHYRDEVAAGNLTVDEAMRLFDSDRDLLTLENMRRPA